jgi:hypothetical protein
MKLTDMKEMAHNLWVFFASYWDDHITNPGRQEFVVHINARTIRVLREIYGHKLFDYICERWSHDGSIRILASSDLLEPEDACVEIVEYPKEVPLSEIELVRAIK